MDKEKLAQIVDNAVIGKGAEVIDLVHAEIGGRARALVMAKAGIEASEPTETNTGETE